MQKLTLKSEQFTDEFILNLVKSGVTFEAMMSSCGQYIEIIFTGGY